jgi:calcineurin-like phosphoesterase family protein
MSKQGKVWFTADQHFGHQNVIKFGDRPFTSVDEMDRDMIAMWNAVVRPGDVVWHLGDLAYKCHPQRLNQVFSALNGTKNLIRGNHDLKPTLALGWASVQDFKEIAVDGQRMSLFHYGMRVWPGQHRGAIMLYGHSHGRLPGYSATMDVGVDNVGFSPIDIDSIRARLADLPSFKIEDAGDQDNEDDLPTPP